MNIREYLASDLHYAREATLRLARGLTPEELRFRATPAANSIGFLLWHIGRTEDRWFNERLAKSPQVWVSGWSQKLGLPADDTGFGYTTEQVEKLLIPDLNLLLAYMDAVHTLSQAAVLTYDAARLDATVLNNDPGRPRTPFQIFRQVAHHENQHNGQIDFIRGNFLRKPA